MLWPVCLSSCRVEPVARCTGELGKPLHKLNKSRHQVYSQHQLPHQKKQLRKKSAAQHLKSRISHCHDGHGSSFLATCTVD